MKMAYKTITTNFKGMDISFQVRLNTWDEQIIGWIQREYERAFDLPLNGLPIIDIGAHIGAFSQLAAVTYPSSKIYCYEPYADSYRLLAENMFGRNCELHQAAISGGQKYGRLAKNIEVGQNQVIWEDVPSKGLWCYDLETVDCIPINSVLDQLAEIGLLKMDCEGSELGFLPHLSNANKQKIRFIVGEVHPEKKEIYQLISPYSDGEIIRQFFRGFKIFIDEKLFFGWRKDIEY
ncbi:MAG: hypothetical protein A3B89_03665 [Candidatus Buchananbacteria bacterium RIFCSPHIGHO2_02_FULL_40_13]|nr:MAG: hypothetical protein A3B89_03665 [Candidatus Buchananbacteria bacterium RIFCSPHIGHO2_02_FULL_40_13]